VVPHRSGTKKACIEAEVHRLVTASRQKSTRFYWNTTITRLFIGDIWASLPLRSTRPNELSYLETIHLFVELLTPIATSVSLILSLISTKFSTLDEFILAGGKLKKHPRGEILIASLMEKME
jgi:hypothetical protein